MTRISPISTMYPAPKRAIKKLKRKDTEIITPPQAAFTHGNNHDWAVVNNKNGKNAFTCSSISLAAGFGKSFFINRDNNNAYFVKEFFNLIQNCSNIAANNLQYEIYSRPDDDLGQHKVEEELYENKTSIFLAKVACTTERKINPILKTVALFFSENIREGINTLSAIPGSLWWRGKYIPFINQRLGNHLVSYAVHKIPAIFGNENSTEVINEINEDEILNWDYIKERLQELSRYNDKQKLEHETCIKYLFDEVRNIFSSDLIKANNSIDNLSSFLSPTLGAIGLTTQIAGSILKAGLKSNNIESRFINTLASFSQATQNLIYYFRFTMPKFIEVKQQIKEGNISSETITRNKLLCRLGLLSNISNFAAPIFEVVDTDNKWFQIGRSLIKELADNTSSMFFAKRREDMGKRWLAANLSYGI